MNSIAIVSEPGGRDGNFRAVSGGHQSVGKTMGEALDALTAQIGESRSGALVLIQRREPDEYFTEHQHDRMQELLARRDNLVDVERAELEDLVDAELDATIARTNAFVENLAS